MGSSGWQLAGDAPTAYTRFGHQIMELWTDDLIQQACNISLTAAQ